MAKTFDREDLGGLHRYEVAQGFQPKALRFSGVSVPDVLGQACDEMGSGPIRRWSSDEVEGWELAAGGVVPMGVTPPDPEVMRAWVLASRTAQGLPATVTDPGALGDVAVLLVSCYAGTTTTPSTTAAGPCGSTSTANPTSPHHRGYAPPTAAAA